jgi:hypothetical protein
MCVCKWPNLRPVRSTSCRSLQTIGELHKLVGENYKDKNECAKAVASSFALIGMTQQEGLESYQELYDNSRPT